MKGMTSESDMRSVWDMIHNDKGLRLSPARRVAMDVHINASREVRGVTAELGGLDVITFTAGTGEQRSSASRAGQFPSA